jgi:hypothetical protein
MAFSIYWASIATTIFNLHQWADGQPVDVMGKRYVVQVRGRVHKLKWVWDGQFKCISEDTGIVGTSRHYYSRNDAASNAIKDYFIQAGQRGLFTEDQINQFTN